MTGGSCNAKRASLCKNNEHSLKPIGCGCCNAFGTHHYDIYEISVGCLNKFHEAYTALHVNVLHRAASPRQLHRITY